MAIISKEVNVELLEKLPDGTYKLKYPKTRSTSGITFDSHLDNKSNPHGVTKSQVSLGSVQNYGLATKTEAETGTSNVKYMTPLRTAEAILKMIEGKVDKEAGKGLSSNDFTTVEKNKLSGVETGAQVNKVTSVASKTGVVTLVKSDVGLANVDNVKQASKAEFNTHNSDTTKHITSVERSNWNAKETTSGAQSKADTAESNAKDYADAGLADKVDKATGKGLSTNDYTTAEKNKLVGIQAGAQVNAVTSVASKTGAVTLTKTDVGLANVDNVKQASKTEFDSHDSNTTKHLTSAERTNWNSKETTTGSQTKATLAETNAKDYADTELTKKVDKVTGKVLSTNDYTTAEKNKLSGIATGAQVNTVTSVAGRTGAVVVSKSDVGLSNVENLSAASIRSGTTKANVGLGNVDNIKQMPISGGVLENYREKLATVSAMNGSINLNLGNVFQHSPDIDIVYSITNAVNGQAHSFTLIINMGSTVGTLTFPASVKWQGGDIPDMSEVNKTYVLTFMTVDGGTNWLGMFGGEF